MAKSTTAKSVTGTTSGYVASTNEAAIVAALAAAGCTVAGANKQRSQLYVIPGPDCDPAAAIDIIMAHATLQCDVKMIAATAVQALTGDVDAYRTAFDAIGDNVRKRTDPKFRPHSTPDAVLWGKVRNGKRAVPVLIPLPAMSEVPSRAAGDSRPIDASAQQSIAEQLKASLSK